VQGAYRRLAEEGSAQKTRPVYKRVGDQTNEHQGVFLCYRGGNWVVTQTLHSSSLAAPFLIRCPDIPGHAMHPLQLRRPRWYVRTGRGQEELEPHIQVSETRPCHVAGVVSDTSNNITPSNPSYKLLLPTTILCEGRLGEHSELNGCYKLSESTWADHPVYLQVEGTHQHTLFCCNGCWVIASELCSIPWSIARCTAQPASPFEAVFSESWEFLITGSVKGHMVTTETRTYQLDRHFVIKPLVDNHGDSADALENKYDQDTIPRPDCTEKLVLQSDSPDFAAEASACLDDMD